MTEAARTLASEEGLARFQQILAAIDLWQDVLTPVQRRVLAAGGGKCVKVTRHRLVGLGLAVEDHGSWVELTDLGRFVVRVNSKAVEGEEEKR